MILVDFSQVMISNLMVQIGEITPDELNEDLLRHMIFNSLRYYRKRFGKKFGKMVICCDAHRDSYWRKQEFKHYKANRKNKKKDDTIDWNMVYSILNRIKCEVKEFSPYQVIEVNSAEGDDIIGVIARYKWMINPIMIISGDKDFRQLQTYKNVHQYNPVTKKMLVEKRPVTFLKEHILRGDKGDGVPNFLSAEDTFVVKGKRQKSMFEKNIIKWVNQDPKSFCDDTMMERYKTNQRMIDLTFTPKPICVTILSEYDKKPQGSISSLLSFFMKNQMVYLIEKIEEF